jgi:hypothetical protein
MASSREVKVLKKALQLALTDLHLGTHGSCPDPETCCDIEYLKDSYMRRATEQLDTKEPLCKNHDGRPVYKSDVCKMCYDHFWNLVDICN